MLGRAHAVRTSSLVTMAHMPHAALAPGGLASAGSACGSARRARQRAMSERMCSHGLVPMRYRGATPAHGLRMHASRVSARASVTVPVVSIYTT